jgi:hypothetical protein
MQPQVQPYVGEFTDIEPCVSMFGFPTGERIAGLG